MIKENLYHFLRDVRDRWQGKHRSKGIGKKIEFYRQLVKQGDLVFDIGANMGNRVQPFLRLGAKVVAVEPQDDCVSYLKYKFGNKIEIIQKGVGSKAERRKFFVSPINTVSSFAEDWIGEVKQTRFKNVEWKESSEIEMITLDSMIQKYGVPTFMKIDVEGFELEVLGGLSQPVPCFSFEYTLPEQLNKLNKIIDRLESIYPEYQFNYSVGESMDFVMKEWMNLPRFRAMVQTKDFQDTSFGDIYARMRK